MTLKMVMLFHHIKCYDDILEYVMINTENYIETSALLDRTRSDRDSGISREEYGTMRECDRVYERMARESGKYDELMARWNAPRSKTAGRVIIDSRRIKRMMG
jgi:hypothetical protein